MEYIIVEANHVRQLENQVQKKMFDGYEPLGGVAVSWSPGSFQTWAQAMIRKSSAERGRIFDTGPK